MTDRVLSRTQLAGTHGPCRRGEAVWRLSAAAGSDGGIRADANSDLLARLASGMGFTYVDSARCPECDTRITTDDDVGFLQMTESDVGSSELVVCPHCERIIGGIATAAYDSIWF